LNKLKQAASDREMPQEPAAIRLSRSGHGTVRRKKR
jgi:hypothetical protein